MEKGDKVKTSRGLYGYIIKVRNNIWGHNFDVVLITGDAIQEKGEIIECKLEELTLVNEETEILTRNGWTVVCESPLEIEKDESRATGEAAEIIKLFYENDLEY